MKRNFLCTYLALAGSLFLLACNTVYTPRSLAYEGYRITDSLQKDSALIRLTQPYRDSLHKTMSAVVGRAAAPFEKEGANASLGFFMTDAFLQMGRQKMNPRIDAAFVNPGGIRITQLPQGPITRSSLFELMPFDNVLTLQEVSGALLQQYLDFTAARGGWPVSGITYELRDKKAVNVQVGGRPLDPQGTYRILNSDYVVNGGDDLELLRALPRTTTGYLMRDALIDYVQAEEAAGRALVPTTEKRIVHVQ